MTDSTQLEESGNSSSQTGSTLKSLDAIQERADKATEGPWEARDCAPCTERGRLEVNIWDHTGNFLITSWCDEDDEPGPDAVFIAHAREDVPKLVAALRAVEAVHEPVDALMYGGRSQAHKVQVCTGCGQDDGNWQQWPCPTLRAITGALS